MLHLNVEACCVIGELKSANASFTSPKLVQVFCMKTYSMLHLNMEACFVIGELKSANTLFRLPELVQVLYENILYA